MRLLPALLRSVTPAGGVLPCAAYLDGQYGVKELYVGVPVKLGARGIEQIIEIKLTAEEKAGLDKSAAAVKELVGVIGV